MGFGEQPRLADLAMGGAWVGDNTGGHGKNIPSRERFPHHRLDVYQEARILFVDCWKFAERVDVGTSADSTNQKDEPGRPSKEAGLTTQIPNPKSQLLVESVLPDLVQQRA